MHTYIIYFVELLVFHGDGDDGLGHSINLFCFEITRPYAQIHSKLNETNGKSESMHGPSVYKKEIR